MAGLRRLLLAGAVSLALLGSLLVGSGPVGAQSASGPVPSTVPEALLGELLSLDPGPLTVTPTTTGLVFKWAASSLVFDAGAHAVIASGGSAPPFTLRSSVVGPPRASTIAGRIVVDSHPSSHRDVVYVPFAGGSRRSTCSAARPRPESCGGASSPPASRSSSTSTAGWRPPVMGRS